jgi:hypothetical protein
MTDIEPSASAAGPVPVQRPLATFTVFAYNQEDYVAEAVRGALAQQYRPLQVILSDDASTDRTFEIMTEASRACPPDIALVLNRNPVNTGIAEHIDKVIGMAEGKYVVLSAADDVSLPERTGVSVEALVNDEEGRMALHSAVINVDATGRVLYVRENPHRHRLDSPEAVLAHDVYLTGSSVTVDKWMYTGFPALLPDVVNEDKVTAFRCAFHGGAVYIEQPLVRYRAGVGVSTLNGALLHGRDDPAREARYVATGLARRRSVLAQMQADCSSGAITGRVTPALEQAITREAAMLDRLLAFTARPRFLALPGVFAAAGVNRKSVKLAILFLMPGAFSLYKRLARRR